ncbi:hypothetical protein FGG08_001276 [Glutinoglossum americanum]|uniref:Nuclear distribution protein RO10 n=1 Tax=Glutinoglossum americanum TaxID=1670608 RepID=A0A9P8IDV5_9PEZI|nr:hypothetical protein FGG08_001276 [Glutinoglossum americanum]
MENSFDKTASSTVDLLEARLRRVEFLLAGDRAGISHDPPEARDDEVKVPVTERLAMLENALKRLSSKSKVAKEILDLYILYPDLFQSLPPEQIPASLGTSNLLSIVLSSATLYPTAASRLTSILDVPVPPAETSASLIALQPRISKIEIVQEAQTRELVELSRRSTEVLERWYRISVLGGGECWAEWEGRIAGVERGVRRQEAMREKADNVL